MHLRAAKEIVYRPERIGFESVLRRALCGIYLGNSTKILSRSLYCNLHAKEKERERERERKRCNTDCICERCSERITGFDCSIREYWEYQESLLNLFNQLTIYRAYRIGYLQKHSTYFIRGNSARIIAACLIYAIYNISHVYPTYPAGKIQTQMPN